MGSGLSSWVQVPIWILAGFEYHVNSVVSKLRVCSHSSNGHHQLAVRTQAGQINPPLQVSFPSYIGFQGRLKRYIHTAFNNLSHNVLLSMSLWVGCQYSSFTDKAAFEPRSAVVKAHVLSISPLLWPSCEHLFTYCLAPLPDCIWGGQNSPK